MEAAEVSVAAPDPALLPDADLERRFGGLKRLYGDTGYARLRRARVAVVGVGGVGSWAAEALARSGVAVLVLIDADHVSESNINRQVQAHEGTLGQAKVRALAERIALIHPGCRVHAVEEFVEGENFAGLLPEAVDAVIDACDQVRAKAALAAWAISSGVALVAVGAAGGKRRPEAVELADLAQVSHDPLLAAVRQRLRQHHGVPRQGALGVQCVFSREAVRAPLGEPPETAAARSLNCRGYGSAVGVTASFGLVAATAVIERLVDPAELPAAPTRPEPG